WRSRAILSGPAATRNPRAGRNGGYRVFTLVRAIACRTGFRVVDWRSRRDRGQARQEAEDRPRGCETSTEADARRSLSANLGTECGESGPATTAVAPASVGADAHADHEPTSGAGHERRPALEVEAV